MIKTILLGTSLSETSTRTLCCLEGWKKVGAEKVVLVHAMNIRDVGTLYHQLKTLAQPMLQRQAEILRNIGFEVETEIRLGLPYEEIAMAAEAHDASLIAVHLTVDSLLAQAFVGGVAYEVIQRADRPVLAMKAKLDNGGCELLCQSAFHHILFPTDFSENAEEALRFLESLVRPSKTNVTVIHVQTSGQTEDAPSQLAQIAERLRLCGAMDVTIELATGSPTAEILSIVKRNEHSLIVMGSQGKGYIKEIFLGSVSHNLVRHANVPVVLVPLPRANR